MVEVQVKFSPEFPEELRDSTLSRLSPWLRLLDRDLVTLTVAMKGSGDSQAGEASIQVRKRYHVAFMWLDPSFFGLSEEEQDRIVVHEFTHVLMDDFAREVQHLILHMVPEGIQNYIEWRMEDAEEKITDLFAVLLHDAIRDSNRCCGRTPCVRCSGMGDS